MSDQALELRLKALGLHGLRARIEEVRGAPWLPEVLQMEEDERARRSYDRRLRHARLGRFKDMADFDWTWPRRIDRDAVLELLRLEFLTEGANVVLIGPNGVGKTMIGKNLAHAALTGGQSVRFTTASAMLNELVAQTAGRGLNLALRRYCRPSLLVIDEIGYLSYDARHADLLFEVVNRRYDLGRSIVLTTNKPFSAWAEVFPNAGSVVVLVDRLVHRCEVIEIEADSFRLREAEERARRKAAAKAGA